MENFMLRLVIDRLLSRLTCMRYIINIKNSANWIQTNVLVLDKILRMNGIYISHSAMRQGKHQITQMAQHLMLGKC